MKKVLIGIIVVGLIIGLGFGGYWLYRKYINPDVASELEKIEINPDERKELVENLSTKDEKIEMIIQLIEDMNAHKISYNYTYKNLGREGRFYVGDKYEIDFILNPLVKGKDYMGRTYVSGTINTYTLFINGSKTVHQWMELTKETIYKSDKEIEVDLAYEDEVLYGKHDMRYKSTPESEYEDLVENLKKYRSYLELSETDGVYKLIHEGLYIRIETDGITYIDISLSSDSNNHYELNNKELYEKIVASIKGIKNFPIVTNTEEQPSEKSIRLQSKYDHKKLMADYIESIEPKNQTFNVDDINSNQSEIYLSKLESNYEIQFWFEWNIVSGNTTLSKKNIIGLNFPDLDLQKSNNTILINLCLADVSNIKINNSDVSKSNIKKFDFNIIIEKNDNQINLKITGSFEMDYDSNIIKVNYSSTEKGKIDNEKYTRLTFDSNIEISNFQTIDENDNLYIVNKSFVLNKCNVGIGRKLIFDLLSE